MITKIFSIKIYFYLKELLITILKHNIRFSIFQSKWRLFRSLNLTKNIIHKNKRSKKSMVNKIRLEGFNVLPPLNKSIASELKNNYKNNCHKKYGKSYDELLEDLYLSGDSRGLECDFDPIITRNLILQYNIHSELEELLQTSINDIVFRMTCDTIIPPKSLTSYRNVLIKKNYDNALNFHRDLDAHRL